MKAVCKKLFSLMLVAILLVSAVPFQVSAAEANEEIVVDPTEVDQIDPLAAVEQETPKVQVQFQLADSHYQVGKFVNTEVGKKVPKDKFPSGSSALKVFAKTIASGSSEGYEFVGWYLDEGFTTPFDSTMYITNEMAFEAGEDCDILNVYAQIRAKKDTIKLDPKGGTVSKKTHAVCIGLTYGEYETLPTAKREHYKFLGWALKDGTMVADDSEVKGLDTLYAQWEANKYTVSYEAYFDAEGDESAWESMDEKFGPFEVDANSVLKQSYSNLPTTAQAKSLFLSDEMAADGWYIDGWMIKETGATLKEGSTKITGDVTIRPIYKKSIKLIANDKGNTSKNFTVVLGQPVGVLPNPGLRDGETFLAWYDQNGDLVSNVSNLANTAKHPDYYPCMGNLNAEYVPSTVFYLYIYTNNDTKDFVKRVVYYGAPAEGEFKMSDIDLYEIFPNYTKYDDKGDERYGWFDEVQWDKFCLNKPANEVEKILLGSEEGYEDDIHQFYIMLVDNGNNSSNGSNSGSGYNDNSSTRDPSNPSTGDEIYVAVTIMALSAAALVLFFLNKKRIAK